MIPVRKNMARKKVTLVLASLWPAKIVACVAPCRGVRSLLAVKNIPILNSLTNRKFICLVLSLCV